RAVAQQRHFDGRQQRRLQLRQQLLDLVDDLDHVCAGLALDVQDDGRLFVDPRRLPDVFRVVDDVGDVGQPDRRAVPVGDDDGLVFGGRAQLVVGVDRVGARRTVEAALGLVDVGVADGGADVFDVQAVGG